PKRYDLAYVGPYKMNKNLDDYNSLLNQILAEAMVDIESGEVIAEKGEKIDSKLLYKLIASLEREENRLNEKNVTLYNGVTDVDASVQMIKILDPTDSDGERELHVIGNNNIPDDVKHITQADILSSISYFFNLLHSVGNTDD